MALTLFAFVASCCVIVGASGSMITLNGSFTFAEYEITIPRQEGEFGFLFRTTAKSGLVFYQESSVSNDFVALTLRNGRIVLEIGENGRLSIDKANFRYSDGDFHYLALKRMNRGTRTEVAVDEMKVLTVADVGDKPSVDLRLDGRLFVGGFPPGFQPRTRPSLVRLARFAACLQPAKMPRSRPTRYRATLGTCDWCVPERCARTGRCFDNRASGCDCRGSGYTGDHCHTGKFGTFVVRFLQAS